MLLNRTLRTITTGTGKRSYCDLTHQVRSSEKKHETSRLKLQLQECEDELNHSNTLLAKYAHKLPMNYKDRCEVQDVLTSHRQRLIVKHCDEIMKLHTTIQELQIERNYWRNPEEYHDLTDKIDNLTQDLAIMENKSVTTPEFLLSGRR